MMMRKDTKRETQENKEKGKHTLHLTGFQDSSNSYKITKEEHKRRKMEKDAVGEKNRSHNADRQCDQKDEKREEKKRRGKTTSSNLPWGRMTDAGKPYFRLVSRNACAVSGFIAGLSQRLLDLKSIAKAQAASKKEQMGKVVSK